MVRVFFKLILLFQFLIIVKGGVGQTMNQKQLSNCLVGFEAAMNRYSDSLNFVSGKHELPLFIQDYLLDWRLRDYLKDCFGSPLSYRKILIDRTTNEEILERIIKSNNKVFDMCYVPETLKKDQDDNFHNDFPDIPFMKYSTRSLAKMRLAEIRALKQKLLEK